jgi:hypothetical protein
MIPILGQTYPILSITSYLSNINVNIITELAKLTVELSTTR